MATAQPTKAETTLQDEIKKLEQQLVEKLPCWISNKVNKISTLVQSFLAEIEKKWLWPCCCQKRVLENSLVSTRHVSKFFFSLERKGAFGFFCWLVEPTTHHSHCEAAVLALLVLAPGRLTHTRSVHFLCLMVPGCTGKSLLCRLYMRYRREKT